ncbi:JmjC domain-containing protein [Rhizobium ruizarguesonis]
MLEASLLRWPYFTVLQDGRSPSPAKYTSSRDVIGQKRDGFPNAKAIRSYIAAGATLKLNDLGDWSRVTRELVRDIEVCLNVAATSYAFLTPKDNRGMMPHRDAAHVFALQIEGTKEWHLYENNPDNPSKAGLDIDNLQPAEVIELDAGDVLYLPHGIPHDAVARDGQSFHLTVTACEPSPEDLLEGLLQAFQRDYADLVTRHHTRSLADKCAEVRDGLLQLARADGPDRWLHDAIARIRRE